MSTVSSQLDLRKIVDLLGDEPLTHLMLGHRELFHSNLLAWFFEKFPEASDRVFGALTKKADATGFAREVMREQENLDLWFRWPDRASLVIENKVFSLPNEKQLEDYTAKIVTTGESATFWLLSLSDPGWQNDQKVIGSREWRWLSYQRLAESIRSVLPSDDRSYAVETMRHYADVVELLSRLAAKVTVSNPNETIGLPSDIANALTDNRLKSAMEKLRARSVSHRISRALGAAGVKLTDVSSAFTKGSTFVEWFCPVDCAADAKAGWQLQGDQFRLALKIPHLEGRSEQNRKERIEFARKHGNLFDFSCVDASLNTASSLTKPASMEFGSYNPDFIYRYKIVRDLTVSQLEHAAVAVSGRPT